MINKQYIIEEANRHNLPPNTIEKDYVLNWILAGISESKHLKNDWIFKGGTCLKKCYFKNYRFSEDLDFTIVNNEQLNIKYLKVVFEEIAAWIYEQVGLEIPNESIRFELYKNPRGNHSIQGKIAYNGPMQRRGTHPTIKIDLCWDEIIIEPPIMTKIYHPYHEDNFIFKIKTYCLDEILAEKLRALIERMRPRDLYDIIHIFNYQGWSPNHKKVLSILREKCVFKKVEMPTFELINSSPSKADLNNDWENMLAHQIFKLESPNYYWEKLPAIFDWLYQ